MSRVPSISSVHVQNNAPLRRNLLSVSNAKNTNPTSVNKKQQNPLALHELSALAGDISSKPFYVNYKQPDVDTCRDFVEFSIRQSEASRALDILCRPWAPEETAKLDARQPKKLPSWIRDVKEAAFNVEDTEPGQKVGRNGADLLVGLPHTFDQRNYSAAETKRLDLRKLRFPKRSQHYSKFIEGFTYDEIGSTEEIARDGTLPLTWLTSGNWTQYESDPPEDLWRTLVANRGPDGRNPQTFYPTAFKNSMTKEKRGEVLKTERLINHGKCSIVAQFLRRVQAVIWNR